MLRRFLLKGRVTGLVAGILLAMVPDRAMASSAPVFDQVNRYLHAQVLSGAATADLHQVPLASIRVMALGAGGMQPIPFQIDERLPDGTFVADRGKVTRDDTPNLLDADDEIVFLVRDAGFRAPKNAWPKGALKSVEIQLSDPLGGTTGYVYLFAFGGTPPRMSERRHISYDSALDRTSSDTVSIGFDRKMPIMLDHGVFKRMNDSGRDKDVIDRLKIRIKAVTSAGVTISRNEEEFTQELTGVRVGPVRVIRSLQLSVSIPPMPTVPISVTFLIYPDYVDVPVNFEIPGLVSMFMKDMVVNVGVDFDGMQNTTFATLERPRGTIVDGQQPEIERYIPMGSEEWFMMQGRGLNTFVVFELDKELKKRRLKKEIHFMDSTDGSNPPESIPGQLPEIGFALSQWGGLEARKYYFEAKLHFLWEAPQQGGSGYYKYLMTPLKTAALPGEDATVLIASEAGDSAGEKLAAQLREKLGTLASTGTVKSMSRPAIGQKQSPNVVILTGMPPLPAVRAEISRNGSYAVLAGEETRHLEDGITSVGLVVGPRALLGLIRQFFTGKVKAGLVISGLSRTELKDYTDGAQRLSIELVQLKPGPDGRIDAGQTADLNVILVPGGESWTSGGGKAFAELLKSAHAGGVPVPVFTNSRELVGLGATVGAEPNIGAGADYLTAMVQRYLRGETMQPESGASQFLKIYLNREGVRSSRLLVPPALIRLAEAM